MTRPESEGPALGQPSALSRQAILDELDAAQVEFRLLIEAMSNDDLRRKTMGTRWTNRELLFHMLFGYLIVRTLLWFCVVLSRLAPGATKSAAATLDGLVKTLQLDQLPGVCHRRQARNATPDGAKDGPRYPDIGTLVTQGK